MKRTVGLLTSWHHSYLPILIALLTGLVLPTSFPSHTLPAAASPLGNLPLSFEPNVGQTDASVRFMVHAPGTIFYFTPSEVVLDIASQAGQTKVLNDAASQQKPQSNVLRLQFINANSHPEIEGGASLPGKVNYLLGNDPSRWHTGVSTYEDVTYNSLYPGVDLNYASSNSQVKGTYTVAAGTDPCQIRWRYGGANGISVTSSGDLQVRLKAATPGANPVIVTERAPVAWQEIRNKHVPVPVQYVLAADGTVSFALGEYNPAYPLTIDPTIAYSTYLGGSGTDHGLGIAVDTYGSIYLSGYTNSTNFPLANPYMPSYRGGAYDGFVTKLNAEGNTLIYSTYLGGSGSDSIYTLALDTVGNTYLTGPTTSFNFPVVNPIQSTYNGQGDLFVTKMNATGSALLYSTYLGGSNIDESGNLALDTAGNVYVAGNTYSSNFPLVNPYQPTLRGIDDAFVAKINPSGSAMIYSTYFGGSAADAAYGIAVDTFGNAHLSGYTLSYDLPLMNPYQPTFAGVGDAFVAKFNPLGSALLYSSYLGGSDNDVGAGITVDADGNAYQTGFTYSANFPVRNAFQPAHGGDSDVFITKWNSTGSMPIYASYLGGNGDDKIGGPVLDSNGGVSLVGSTRSTNFPLVNPLQPALRGIQDAYITTIHPLGTSLTFSSYLGGSSLDISLGLVVDATDNLYLSGSTSSFDFPMRNPFQPTLGGAYDAFIVKLSPNSPTPTSTPTNTPTETPTSTPTNTPTNTPTSTLTSTPTSTDTPTYTPTSTLTYTATPTHTATNTSTPTPTPCAQGFTDVAPTDYFYEGVRYLYCNGVISGYADNTFRPYTNTTRGQMAKIVVLAFNLDIYTPPNPTFSDVPTDHSFYTYIETAAYNRIVSGYADSTFRPYTDVTRGQLSKIVVIAAQWPSVEPPVPTFSDVPPENPFYTFIETAVCYAIVGGYSDGTFRPGNNATRGQIAKIVHAAVLSQSSCR